MKSKILSALSVLLIIAFSGFSDRNLHAGATAAAGKKNNALSYFNNDAWISSTYDFMACPNQHYNVRDAAPGDTFHWYVTWEDWTMGTTDFGTDRISISTFRPAMC